MNDKLLFFVMGLLSVSSLLLLVSAFTPTPVVDELFAGDLLGDHYDRVGLINCETDSMGLSINCGDVTYSRNVGFDDELELGEIYIYKDPEANHSVIHRLVLELSNGSLVFKGDNNEWGELVPREWVLAEPLWMKYG
jgi:hypothetical protein